MFFSTKLIDAAEEGRLEDVQKHLAQGADINERGMLKMTALMAAAAKGHEDIVSFLLQQPNIEVDILNAGGTTALMAAARQGHLGVVKILLDDPRCDVNTLGKFGGTALMNAAGFGHIDIVKEMLKIEGISLAATYTDEKFSPITIAQKNGHTDIAALLESHAAQNFVHRPRVFKPPRI